jgi:hypothetical protein
MEHPAFVADMAGKGRNHGQIGTISSALAEKGCRNGP